MSGVLEDIWQSLVNLYELILGFFNFEVAGKNIRTELNDIIQSLITFLVIYLVFRTLFSKSQSKTGKFILILLFVLLYLFVNIWIF